MSLRSLIAATGVVLIAAATASAADRLIWFDAPAGHFTESTPLGNGRLGAMMFGGVRDERIVLNEHGMWTGSPQDADRPNAAAALPEIRRLLLAGDNVAAERLVNEGFTCAGAGSNQAHGTDVPYGCYQTLGDLRLEFVHDGADAPVTDYRRELDLGDAVARLNYTQGGVEFTRECFVSAADQAIVLRLAAERKGRLSFDAWLERPERVTVEAADKVGLEMHGQLNDGRSGDAGVRYAARMRILAAGGNVTVEDGRAQVRGANEVVLLVTAATDIKTFAGRKVDDARAAAAADMEGAAVWPVDELRQRHVADYRQWFDRVSLRLAAEGQGFPAAANPTPDRLAAYQRDPAADPELPALYFDFGRYLLISSSRPGGLPANLQGLWAEEINTPWNGDWHLNINAQMNYWPAEVCNLSELHEPLFALIGSLQKPGEQTAKKYYGARGWVAHLLANPWGFTSPGESASWGATSTCSAWMCQHLWDHYLYTGDREFLERAYPLMKGSAQFYLDMLIEEPKHGWLVTAPSNSPENAFRTPDGAECHVCLGPTMDQQLLRYLFGACIDAAKILEQDEEFGRELTAKRERLAPTRIGSDGRVMEWLEEYDEVDPHHRHVSHMWGLYPGDEINPATTPDLAAAARKTLDARGDAGTGWSLAHKIALWARLGDGERAFKILGVHLRPTGGSGSRDGGRWTGGTYPNLFDAHPPFQIDGNFGGAATIAEMLLQSRSPLQTRTAMSEIVLLPALPKAWPAGAVRGLRARGGFEVDVAWANGRVTTATVRSESGGKAQVRFGQATHEVNLDAGGETNVVFDP